eukprot:scaffold13451_cov303-Alexandrium_tamarense.AAC.1
MKQTSLASLLPMLQGPMASSFDAVAAVADGTRARARSISANKEDTDGAQDGYRNQQSPSFEAVSALMMLSTSNKKPTPKPKKQPKAEAKQQWTRKKVPSAFNLFYQYKVHRIRTDPDESSHDYSPLPGLEDMSPNDPLLNKSEQEITRYRKEVIEKALSQCVDQKNEYKQKLPEVAAQQFARGFVDMGKFMSKEWAKQDKATKSIFTQISKERKAKQDKAVFDAYRAASRRYAFPSLNVLDNRSMPLERHGNLSLGR